MTKISPILVLVRFLLGLSFILSVSAQAKRLALVMGNDNYTSVTKLQKAGNDATAMARELKAAGITVQLHKDLNYRGMVKAVETFTNSITGGDEVVKKYCSILLALVYSINCGASVGANWAIN
jgi:hypothetical protein